MVREVREELGVTAKITRPLWLSQAFFAEDVEGVRYHELGLYFLRVPAFWPGETPSSGRKGITSTPLNGWPLTG